MVNTDISPTSQIDGSFLSWDQHLEMRTLILNVIESAQELKKSMSTTRILKNASLLNDKLDCLLRH